LAPRAREKIVRPRRPAKASVRPLKRDVRRMGTDTSLVYDYAASGPGTARFSTGVVLGCGLFMLLLGVSTVFLPRNSGNYLSGFVLIPIGAWMFLTGVHLRRDRHAFVTRYVLSDDGIEISTSNSPPNSLSWTQINSGYQSRLLRYFRLASPGLEPSIVLIFGAPPKVNAMAGGHKYGRTRDLLIQKLNGRFTSGLL
jgi:hypothetical protein